MLFGGDAGHGLEPVSIVGSPLLQGPNLHSFRNFVGYIQRQTGTGLDTGLPGFVDFHRKPLLHDRLVKYIAAKDFRDIQ